MHKHYIIEQPPLSSKYRLLVDDLNETATFGITTDLDKVLYNRKIIGDYLNISLEIHTALSDEGMTGIYPIGRYITIWQIRKDEKFQRIWFFDYEVSHIFRDALGNEFSATILDAFENCLIDMGNNFSKEDDIVQLVMVNE